MNKITPQLILVFSLGFFLSACARTVSIENQRQELGRLVFLDSCASCHGINGEGYANELGAPSLDSNGHAWHHPDQEICNWILNGKLGLGREMPPLGDELSNEEVQAVIEYLHSLWDTNQLATQQDMTARWPTPLDNGCFTD